MANLTLKEKRILERLLKMGSGDVLDFSKRTLDELVLDVTGRSILDDKYARASGSKANRIRAFWEVEGNHVVAKLLTELVDYAAERPDTSPELMQSARHVVTRLTQDAPVAELDAVTAIGTAKDLDIVSKAVRQAIENNEPELGLDRLHTFVKDGHVLRIAG